MMPALKDQNARPAAIEDVRGEAHRAFDAACLGPE
jgi:hypothetical protein